MRIRRGRRRMASDWVGAKKQTRLE